MKDPHHFFAEARDALAAVRAANREDLREYPGKRGERAHRRLHRELGKLLKSKKEST
jgi:hypothetical protein